jgi:hypothetical protein
VRKNREACRIGAELFVAEVSGAQERLRRPTGEEMQYLISVIYDSDDVATPQEMAAIDAFNDRLQADGHWVFAGGLAAPSSATVIDNRGEQALFTDGPFLESKEHVSCRRPRRRRMRSDVSPGRTAGSRWPWMNCGTCCGRGRGTPG